MISAGEFRNGVTFEQDGQVGELIAEKAKAAGVESVVFDRNGYLYHGRVKQLADACRKGRLEKTSELTDKLWKAVVHYGNLEISRPNDKPRFHASCLWHNSYQHYSHESESGRNIQKQKSHEMYLARN